MRFPKFVLAVVFLALVAPQAKAENVLYFVDGNNGPTDEMAAALAALGETVTLATSPTDFATKISGGTFNLGIFSAQETYGPDYSTALAALGTFVAGGGSAIVDDWFTPSGADIAPFDTSFTGNTNFTSFGMTSYNSGVTNPVAVADPTTPYADFSPGLAALSGGQCVATFDPADCAVVVGNSGRSFVNGFLNDTAGSAGEQIYINEITGNSGSPNQPPTPEPTSLLLLGTGLLGVLGVARKKLSLS